MLYQNIRIVFYVVRYTNNNFIESKPCKHCIEYIRKTNINKIIYSTNDNNFISIPTNIIISNHVSKKFR